jgi:peptide/nickel transport system permease protein
MVLKHAAPQTSQQLLRVLRPLIHDGVAVAGFLVVATIVLAAVFAPYIVRYGPNDTDVMAILQGPNAQHPLGTDDLGRDMLSRIIYGARVSLQVSLGTILVATPLGVAIGLVAGYVGGRWDSVISRLLDIGFAFPALLLALLIVAILGVGLTNLTIALIILYTPRFARVTRGSVLLAKAESYVEAARAAGCGELRIMGLHILPNILSPIIIQATITLATAVLAEAGLSFLGLGVQPPTPAWGSMLSAGRVYMEQQPHLTIFPGLAIMLTVLGFNFLGDGLRDALDPRLRT